VNPQSTSASTLETPLATEPLPLGSSNEYFYEHQIVAASAQERYDMIRLNIWDNPELRRTWEPKHPKVAAVLDEVRRHMDGAEQDSAAQKMLERTDREMTDEEITALPLYAQIKGVCDRNPKIRKGSTDVSDAEWREMGVDPVKLREELEEFKKSFNAPRRGFLLDYDEFLAKAIEPRRALMTDSETGGEIFLSSSINQVFAYRGIGKTAVTQAMVKVLTNGGQHIRFASKGGNKVILVDGELPAPLLQDRCKTFVGPVPKDTLRLVTREGSDWFPKLGEIADQKRFIDEIALFKADVIIFDTLSSIFRIDTNDSEAWDTVNEFLTHLRSLGYCVILVHHAGKNGTQRGRTDGDDRLDVSIRLDAPENWEPGQGLSFDLSYEKVRHAARLTPFSARLDGAGNWVIGVRSKDMMREAVKNSAASKKSQREIAADLGVSQATVHRILKAAGQ
jgi:AAA domain/Homeodomain-like domain